ncbi:MAG: DUF3043 domain-containing protein [Mycobacteriales bacterium]
MASLLRRGRATAEPTPEVVAPRPGGKGRPTPSRSAARAARSKTVTAAPANRREAAARRRDERRTSTASYRQALRSTDPAKLPEAERVRERVLARDVVDGRINAGPLFMVAGACYVVGGFIPKLAVQQALLFVFLMAFIAVALDSVLLAARVRRLVAATYPGSTERVRWYAVRRALLPRRWRLPVPRVAAPALLRRRG